MDSMDRPATSLVGRETAESSNQQSPSDADGNHPPAMATIPSPNDYILRHTLRDFKSDLYDPKNDFKAFVWIFRLVQATVHDFCLLGGCSAGRLASCTPFLAISLILAVFVSYMYTIRTVIRSRWCPADPAVTGSSCHSIYLHDFTVVYLSFMCLCHYLRTSFTSPGVQLRRDYARDGVTRWRAQQGQGGMYGWDTRLDPVEEQGRVALYGPFHFTSAIDTPTTTAATTDTLPNPAWTFPGAEPSFCGYCRHIRPPRCHHCSICDRCVLQYDHHCFWINNCIGYNNYRSFILTLAFVTLACWYGVALLFWPFYESIRDQIHEKGWARYLYSSKHGGAGLLDLPSMTRLLALARSKLGSWLGDVNTAALGGTEEQRIDLSTVVLHVVYALLLVLGTVVSLFCGQHLKYVITARTTLEHQVFLEDSLASYMQSTKKSHPLAFMSSNKNAIVFHNPFDQGSWSKNWRQIMGDSWIALLLPLHVNIPPPYLPQSPHDKQS